jgi:hypothetical protein
MSRWRHSCSGLWESRWSATSSKSKRYSQIVKTTDDQLSRGRIYQPESFLCVPPGGAASDQAYASGYANRHYPARMLESVVTLIRLSRRAFRTRLCLRIESDKPVSVMYCACLTLNSQTDVQCRGEALLSKSGSI